MKGKDSNTLSVGDLQEDEFGRSDQAFDHDDEACEGFGDTVGGSPADIPSQGVDHNGDTLPDMDKAVIINPAFGDKQKTVKRPQLSKKLVSNASSVAVRGLAPVCVTWYHPWRHHPCHTSGPLHDWRSRVAN